MPGSTFCAFLSFSGIRWLWPLVGAMAIGLAFVFYTYRVAPRGPARWICAALKLLGLAALAFCLLEPLWSGQRARPGANLFAIVADNSQGLQVHDRGVTQSRGDILRELLAPQAAGWQESLEEDFELRRYYFDSRLQTTRDFSELAFDGRATALGSALRNLADRYHGRPLAGILLLTDGNATDLRQVPDLPGVPPVYPVVLGSTEPIKDIAIQQARTTQTEFEDAPVSIQADVAVTGFPGESLVARLLDVAGKQVAEQSQRARKETDLLSIRFQFKPEQQGLSFYRVQVRARNELQAANTRTPSAEATLANNQTVLVVDRGQGPYRVLYVSGRPNWEFKFLNRALADDPQLQLIGLIRVARREPKFNFLGRVGETSNPLFRGFGNQSAEEIERYDQPVLVRLNTRDELELRSGFPRTAEELYAYHAVIVDDLEAEFFTAEQAALLQKFVSERGGGFMMLGGMECFQEGKYQRTPIGDMLPVYLEHAPLATNAPGPLRFELTREGLLQSWARLRDNEADEKARQKSMAQFQVLNQLKDVKPGASVIATVTEPNGKAFPALTVQRFGRGRTAALTVGDVWRWGLRDAEAHRDMDHAWRQLVRWLVTDVPRRVEVAAEPQPNEPNGTMSLQVRVRDPKFQPLDDASVTVEIQPVLVEGVGATTNHSLRLQAEPSSKEPGLFEASYVPRLTGGYRATAFVTNSTGAEVGHAATGWSTDLAADEFRSLTPNVAFLESLARKTGGEVIAPDKLAAFARSLPHRQAPVMEAWTYPFWHTPAMFAFALACFIVEWGLRRWKGMP